MDYATTIIGTIVVSLLLLGFLLAGWRDFLLLFRRPTARLGTGLSRVWSVARVTMLEVRSQRAWVLLVLFFIAFSILMLVAHPFEETDRIPLYIRSALLIQEIIVLVAFWVMASVSLPKERERKTIVTNATKPVSRFEIMLGKIVGFSVSAAVILAGMGLITYVMLVVANQNLKARAMEEYRRAETDYNSKAAHPGNDLPPPAPKEKLALAQAGSLFAYNYIAPRPGNFSVIGRLDTSVSPPMRWLMGGSDETIVYRFPGRIAIPLSGVMGVPGSRPAFVFQFPVRAYSRNITQRLQIRVTAYRVKQPLQSEEKTLELDNEFKARWELDRPDELFSVIDPVTGKVDQDLGEVEVRVSCPTYGVYLGIFDGAYPDAKGNMPSGANFNVFASPAPGYFYQPFPDPVVHGFERRGSQQIGGPDYSAVMRGEHPPREMGLFRFSAEDLKKVHPNEDGTFTVSMFLDVEKQKNEELDTSATVQAFSAATPDDIVSHDVPVVEKRRTDVKFPMSILGDLSKPRDLYVALYCNTPGHYIGAVENSVRIEQPPSFFAVNLLKSEAVLLTEATLLVVICVACSVRLDWPVAMLLAALAYVLGHIQAFVAGLLSYGGLTALNLTPYGNYGPTYRFFDRVTEYLWKTLDVLVHLLPNFSRYDSVAFIADLRNRPWENLGMDALTSCLYALPFIIMGYLLIRKQELG
ncbi:MAG TPA: ABC transporter permease [Phycisphaerae bacterium]|nr:ABC transporter permease [Phycisphaerae bacterium]